MADEEKNDKGFTKADLEDAKREKIRSYEKLIERLKTQRDGLNSEMNKEFREMRRYVQSNPEEGVLLAFTGGIALGYLLGKLGDK